MRPTNTALIVGIVVCFCVVVIACVAMFIADPTGEGAATLATLLLGSLASTIAALAALAKVMDVDKKVEYLANGGTDSKVRAGLADVVKPELLRDDVDQLLEDDRAHRAAGLIAGNHAKE